jgi:hypothetical protein
MMPEGVEPDGKVIAVSVHGKHRFSKVPRPSVTLVAGNGIKGDAHYGPFVKHRYLVRRNPRSANVRQVHLMPSETLVSLRAAGYDVRPGKLGENITTAGLDLESLALNTELRIGASARIRLTGLRTPCVLIDRFRSGLKGLLLSDEPGPPFRAGVMGIVIESGDVSTGDDIRVDLPAAPRSLLPPL